MESGLGYEFQDHFCCEVDVLVVVVVVVADVDDVVVEKDFQCRPS
jgi:hypothetical protein